MKIKLLVFSLLCSFVNMQEISAQLLQWNTFGNTGTETVEPSVANNVNISASNLTFGSGVTPAANGNRFGGNNWFDTGDANAPTEVSAISGNDYIEFIVTPNSGFTFTPTSFQFYWQSSASGPGMVSLRSSSDNYSSVIGTQAVTSTINATIYTINITGITNASLAITFRLYGYSNAGSNAAATGTGGFDIASNIVNVQLNGTTAAISGNTITVTQATGGTITPATATYANGSSQAFTATPTSCYDFTSWTIDGVPNASTTNPYTFTNITANHTITAVYTIKTSAITATAGANGSISPSGVTNLNCGTNQAYTITPSAGYVVQDVLVDGVSVGAVTSYTFTSVTAGPHTISASFVTAPAGPCLSSDFFGWSHAYGDWTHTENGTWTAVSTFAGTNQIQMNDVGDYLELPPLNYPSSIDYDAALSSAPTTNNRIKVQYFDGSIWVDVQEHTCTSTTFSTFNAVFPIALNSLTNVRIRLYRSADDRTHYIDNLKVYCATPPVGPEINIQGNSTSIIDGDNTPNVLDDTDFGTTTLSTNSVKTYTIQNTGTTDLILSLPITLTDVSIPQEFTITQPASATVAAGSSINFTVTFNSAIGGTFTNTLNINSNDANEALYNFDITATATSIVNNDLCSNAIEILVNMPAISGNMSGATRTPNPFNTKIDRWYKFTPTCSSTHAITVSGFSGDIDIELFSGSCPASTTYLDTSAGTSSTETISMALTTGTTYYLRVLAWNAAAETSVFNVQVTAGSSLNISNVGSPATGNINTGTANAVIMGITTTPACALNYEITTITLTKAQLQPIFLILEFITILTEMELLMEVIV